MYQHILIATDGSPPAEAAVDQAVTLATTVDADLSGVSVVDTMAYGVTDVRSDIASEQLTDTAESALETVVTTATEAGLDASTEVLHGSPAAAIREYATEHDIDLIVVGTHGRRGVRRVLLGSVAERVTRTAPCSVLVVRAGEDPLME